MSGLVNRIKSAFHNSGYYRNKQTINGKKVSRHNVNVEYSNFPIDAPLNIGDTLTPVVFKYLCDRFGLINKRQRKIIHLNMIGSIIGFKNYDAIIWGSGILKESFENKIKANSTLTKYDIRAVRGPLTRDILLRCNYDCPEIYGDPAILMPLIYHPEGQSKKYEVSIIKHYSDHSEVPSNFHEISVVTGDYKHFIDEICASKLVISSSLHGLIIAESYGIPTIWYNPSGRGEFKYRDWYLSLGIKRPAMIQSLTEIGQSKNINLEYRISEMANPLLKAFPLELWRTKHE